MTKIVLDLEYPQIAVRALEMALRDHTNGDARTIYRAIADQIEAQTKPVRIPEPGLWGVVEAKITGSRLLRKALRVAIGEPEDWLLLTNEAPRRGLIAWDDLGSPEQVREGLS